MRVLNMFLGTRRIHLMSTSFTSPFCFFASVIDSRISARHDASGTSVRLGRVTSMTIAAHCRRSGANRGELSRRMVPKTI
jgi:hypothetical protein